MGANTRDAKALLEALERLSPEEREKVNRVITKSETSEAKRVLDVHAEGIRAAQADAVSLYLTNNKLDAASTLVKPLVTITSFENGAIVVTGKTKGVASGAKSRSPLTQAGVTEILDGSGAPIEKPKMSAVCALVGIEVGKASAVAKAREPKNLAKIRRAGFVAVNAEGVKTPLADILSK